MALALTARRSLGYSPRLGGPEERTRRGCRYDVGVGRACRYRVSGRRRFVRVLLLTSLAMLRINALIGCLAVGLSAAAGPVSKPSARDQRAADVAESLEPTIAPRAWKTIVVHHSATSGGDVGSIDAVHRRQKDRAGRPWLGIGYHFVIGNGNPLADGDIRPTFRWLQQLPGACGPTGPERARHRYLPDR